MAAIQLKTERLTLRPLQISDAEDVIALAGERDVARMTARIPHPYSLAQAQEWIASIPQSGEIVFAILHGDDFVGCAGYMPEKNGTAEFGYWIGKPYWNRGFATEAARAVAGHAFGPGGITRLDAGHFVDNPASERVLLKLGFKRVDTGLWPCVARGEDVPCVGYRLAVTGRPATSGGN